MKRASGPPSPGGRTLEALAIRTRIPCYAAERAWRVGSQTREEKHG